MQSRPVLCCPPHTLLIFQYGRWDGWAGTILRLPYRASTRLAGAQLFEDGVGFGLCVFDVMLHLRGAVWRRH